MLSTLKVLADAAIWILKNINIIQLYFDPCHVARKRRLLVVYVKILHLLLKLVIGSKVYHI